MSFINMLQERYRSKRLAGLVYLFILERIMGLLLFPWKKRRRFLTHPNKVRNVLLVELAHIGDIMMVIPVVKRVKELFPLSRVHVLVRSQVSILLKHVEGIDEVHVFDAFWINREGNRWQLDQVFRVLKRLRGERYDLGIDFRGSFLNIFFMILAGIRERVGYTFRGSKHLLTIPVDMSISMNLRMHQVLQNMKLVENASRKLTGKGDRVILEKEYLSRYPLKLEIPSEMVERARMLLKCTYLEDTSIRRIAVHAGGAMETKLWLLERFNNLLLRVKEKYSGFIILVGGNMDIERSSWLSGELGDRVVDLTGSIDLLMTAAVISQCDLFIGNDSGPMHVAASVGVPVIGIFGGYNHPSRWIPWTAKRSIVHKKQDCGCCEIPWCKSMKCLEDITVDDVFHETITMVETGLATTLRVQDSKQVHNEVPGAIPL